MLLQIGSVPRHNHSSRSETIQRVNYKIHSATCQTLRGNAGSCQQEKTPTMTWHDVLGVRHCTVLSLHSGVAFHSISAALQSMWALIASQHRHVRISELKNCWQSVHQPVPLNFLRNNGYCIHRSCSLRVSLPDRRIKNMIKVSLKVM